MDSKEDPNEEGHRHNTVIENSDTMALHRKRARRVSFAAEMTSVHFFDRDDEECNETPLVQTAKIDDDSAVESGSYGHSKRNKEYEGEDDGDNNDEEMEIRRTFLRPISSPSPGGSTFGSASSNDEDNFFGPVSANFIKPGRLSDSVASDDNHDVTMDSTAFSMHFRSLASSESGLDLKTPTGGRLFFEEKTPTNSNTGSSIVVTLGKRPIKKSPVPAFEVSGSHSSNDMSLVGGNSNKYDYDKLSPGLDAILTEGRKNLLSVSVSDDITSVSPIKKAGKALSSVDLGDNLVNLGNPVKEGTGLTDYNRVLNGDEFAAENEFGEVFLTGPSPNRFLTCTLGASASRYNNKPNNSPYQLNKNESEMPLVPSASSPVKQQQILLAAASPSKPPGLLSPFAEQPGSLVKNGRLEHLETETSIQRSISKLELLEKSTFSSTFSAKIDKSTVKSLDFSKSPYFDNLLEKRHHISRISFREDSVTGEKAASVLRNTERKFSFSMDHARGDNHLKEPSCEIMRGEGRKAITPEFVPSPARMLVKKFSASPGFQSSQSNDLLLQSQIKQIENFDNGQDSSSVRNLAHSTPSSATANMGGALSKGTSAKENKSQIVHLENLVLGNLTSSGFSSFKVNIPGAESRIVSHDFNSPSAKKNLDQPSFQKSLVQFPTGSPSRKDPVSELPSGSGIPSPKRVQLGGLDNFSVNKRNLELLTRDTRYKTDITIMGTSPKLQKGGSYEPETIVYPVECRTNVTGHKKKTWTNTYSKFTEDLKTLIFGSVDELNSLMIDVLEDKLFRQQRSKVYEIIHLGVMPQNKIVHDDLQLEKIAEANSLLHRVVFEKAKLQLKHVKRERLLKMLELLSTRMQESQILGANIVSLPLETCTSNVQDDAVVDQSLSMNLKKEHEVFHEKLTTSAQALETLDRKILNLTRAFHACCKMKAEPGSGDKIALVNEYLMKKASCRFIRLDMQMWVVHRFGSVNRQHNVLLNYLDFIMQSTKIIVGPTSSCRTSFKLNETNIAKNFPNMDTCTAFSFLFDGETVRKYVGAKTLVHQTQVTNSLLGTLLDVIEEVQLAQTEFQNLTQTSFCSPSAGRLDLMLCFFNFNSGSKVILTLDMCCLKCGIYPSEVLPLSDVDSKKCSSPGSMPIYDEIKNAVKGVKTGYMRILRLCRCVSQVVQASTA